MKKRAVVSLPSASALIVAGIFGIIAIIILWATLSGLQSVYSDINWTPPLIGILCCVALGAAPGLYGMLSRVIADEQGLRWRIWLPWKPTLKWRTATWEEVRDFYVTVPRSGNTYHIETDGNPTLTLDANWETMVPLREAITEHAVAASAARDLDGNLRWMRKGMRRADFPITFSYSETKLKTRWLGLLIGSISSILLCTLFAVSVLLLLLFIKEIAAQPGAVGSLVFYAVLAVISAVGFGWVLYQQGSIFRDAKQRRLRGERIIAEADGLTIWREDDARHIPWETIIGYEFPLNYWNSTRGKNRVTPRIRTDNNAEYTYSTLIEDFPLLTMILRNFAKEAVEYKRDQNEKEALGGIAARWSGGEEGKGERVFHRRTRTLQISIWMIGFFFVTTILCAIQLPQSSENGVYGLFLAVPAALALGLFLYSMIIQYQRERFQVGAEGVTYINKNGKASQIRWDDITQEQIGHYAISLGDANNNRIQLDPTRYAYGNELPALLTERLADRRRAAER